MTGVIIYVNHNDSPGCGCEGAWDDRRKKLVIIMIIVRIIIVQTILRIGAER